MPQIHMKPQQSSLINDTAKKKKNEQFIKHKYLYTLAIRLLLRYLIIWRQPAIKAIPTIVPIRIPEINPILFDT